MREARSAIGRGEGSSAGAAAGQSVGAAARLPDAAWRRRRPRRSTSHYQPAFPVRHTFASIRATNGINVFTLRDLLGHTSTRTTERSARPTTETLAAVTASLVS